jgi:antitoxin component YwqK of YwqJK toxin-antitoxin module
MMMRPWCLLPCLLAAAGAGARADAQERKVQGVDMIDGYCATQASLTCTLKRDASGALDGVQRCSEEYGAHELRYQAVYQAGRLHGTLRCWFDKGRPGIDAEYRNGKRHGKTRSGWDEDLKRFTDQVDYFEGMRDGFGIATSTLHSAGKVTVSGELVRMYRKDKEHGYGLRIEGGKVVAYADCMVDGQRTRDDTPCKSISLGRYQPLLDARLAEERAQKVAGCNREKQATYGGPFGGGGPITIEMYTEKACAKEGLSTLYKADRKTKLVETRWLRGQRVGVQQLFFDDGRPAGRIVYEADQPRQIELSYQNGKPKARVTVRARPDRKIEYTFETYFDDGHLESRGRTTTTEDGRRHGSLPLVSDWYDRTSLVGCTSRFSRQGVEVESACYDDDHKLDGRSTALGDGELVERSYAAGVLLSEKRYDAQRHQLRRTTEYYSDGSTKRDTVAR